MTGRNDEPHHELHLTSLTNME